MLTKFAVLASVLSFSTAAFAYPVFSELSCKISNGVTITTADSAQASDVLPVSTKFGSLERAASAHLLFLSVDGPYQDYNARFNVAMENPVYGDVEQYSLKLKLDPNVATSQKATGFLEDPRTGYKLGNADCTVSLSFGN